MKALTLKLAAAQKLLAQTTCSSDDTPTASPSAARTDGVFAVCY